ncbi:MAG: hypothetical protein AAB455_00575 [Patescibacteria group bacterium]
MPRKSIEIEAINTFKLMERLFRWLRSEHSHERLAQLKKFLDSGAVFGPHQPDNSVTLGDALKLRPTSLRVRRVFLQKLNFSEDFRLGDLVSSEDISISRLSGVRGCGIGTLREIDSFFSSFGMELKLGGEQMFYPYSKA